ncbi:hypothetical protein M409DRAFT_56873 [Zasmidium cellare ATCC 36951]|uniref:F-box domain-containing protein n=1 Tax=Zasmidium cellare ATCC 36951 TaxID=1080233 RepID=A0A6A6CAI4_ZASCE|nr:uncharacterized protein M409DRAFT_56873 [Zasmidium cellare ATCC 36951]KAF2164174.1 hypothetical protein M409DRAFT_56873 [Zasmidium cellare ATCC 36951]
MPPSPPCSSSKQPVMDTTPVTTPSHSSTTSHYQSMQAHRPALARRHHYGTKYQSWRRIFNKPNFILEAILLNLPISDLIIAMHISKTWLYVACESPRIRQRLFLWHAAHVIDSRPNTPTAPSTQGFELFPKSLRQGVLITLRSPRRGEYFVLMRNLCENRSLQLLDSKKTNIDLDPLTGKFHVQLFDHSSNLIIDNVFAPYSLSFRCKQPKITGDRVFEYLKTYHSPEDMDWEMMLESMATRTPLEKADLGEIRLKGNSPLSRAPVPDRKANLTYKDHVILPAHNSNYLTFQQSQGPAAQFPIITSKSAPGEVPSHPAIPRSPCLSSRPNTLSTAWSQPKSRGYTTFALRLRGPHLRPSCAFSARSAHDPQPLHAPQTC